MVLLDIAFLVALAFAYPSKVSCDYSYASGGDIRTTSSIAAMGGVSVTNTDCIAVSNETPEVGETVTLTITCTDSGFRGFVSVQYSDNSVTNLLNGGTDCDSNRLDYPGTGDFSGTITHTFVPTKAGDYEIVAVGGSYSSFKRHVKSVTVTGMYFGFIIDKPTLQSFGFPFFALFSTSELSLCILLKFCSLGSDIGLPGVGVD